MPAKAARTRHPWAIYTAGVIVPAVILSGGASTRMGFPKALLEIEGETFLARVARALRTGGADDVVVVTGAHDSAIADWLSRTGNGMPFLRCLRNPRHDQGQLSSLLTAIEALDRPGVAALMVTLVDLPLVRPETVAALLTAWRAARPPVVRPRLGSRHGHPVIFDRAVFDLLRHAPPDRGARAVVHGLGAAVLDVPTSDPGVCTDVDTPGDYVRLLRRAVERQRGDPEDTTARFRPGPSCDDDRS